MKETWKAIPGRYQGVYEISNFNNVRSLDRKSKTNGYILKGKPVKKFLRKGVFHVRLYDGPQPFEYPVSKVRSMAAKTERVKSRTDILKERIKELRARIENVSLDQKIKLLSNLNAMCFKLKAEVDLGKPKTKVYAENIRIIE